MTAFHYTETTTEEVTTGKLYFIELTESVFVEVPWSDGPSGCIALWHVLVCNASMKQNINNMIVCIQYSYQFTQSLYTLLVTAVILTTTLQSMVVAKGVCVIVYAS